MPDGVNKMLNGYGKKGGKLGGPARAAKLTPEQRSEIARTAVAAREAKRAAEKAEESANRKPGREEADGQKGSGVL